MSKKAYWIVYGRCGEYSDFTEWSVGLYDNEEMAQKHAELATAWAKRIVEQCNPYDIRKELTQEIDPYFQTDYTGTEYVVGRVEFCSEIPPALLKASAQ